MKLTDGEIIMLNDQKEYICVKCFNLNNKDYILMMSNFKPLEIKFAEQIINDNKIDIRIINNQEEKTKIMEFVKDFNINAE